MAIQQRILAPINLAIKRSMLDTINFYIGKYDSRNGYTDSLPQYIKFCFDTCCALESKYVSPTKVSSPHLNCSQLKKSFISGLARNSTLIILTGRSPEKSGASARLSPQSSLNPVNLKACGEFSCKRKTGPTSVRGRY